MVIKCYKVECRRHSIHCGEEGPFCYEPECDYQHVDWKEVKIGKKHTLKEGGDVVAFSNYEVRLLVHLSMSLEEAKFLLELLRGSGSDSESNLTRATRKHLYEVLGQVIKEAGN